MLAATLTMMATMDIFTRLRSGLNNKKTKARVKAPGSS